MSRTILQVSEFTRVARDLLEEHFGTVWLTGEISNLATPASGHIYFSLKDEHAQIRCAMFRNRRSPYRGTLENGTEVLLSGNVSIYEARGDFQLIVEYIEPAGEGELRQRFEELKRRLTAEGLFDPGERRSIPERPGRIGIITSKHGAALQDMLATLTRRFPLAEALVSPVMVQGEHAAPQIAHALNMLSPRQCDVVLLARGGGSLEDLWAFNEEIVVRAIGKCKLPVVSGVGHETDTTLADFAADLRCATPTAAAEAVTPDIESLTGLIDGQIFRLGSALDRQRQTSAQRLDNAMARLRHPSDRLTYQAEKLLSLGERMKTGWRLEHQNQHARLTRCGQKLQMHSPQTEVAEISSRIKTARTRLLNRLHQDLTQQHHRLEQAAAQLKALSPTATLDRGFAIVQVAGKETVVRSAATLKPGDAIVTRFANGTANAEVTSTQPGDR